MRVFLTGATGYVGGAVLDALVRGGHSVTALVRDGEKAKRVAAKGARPVVGNLAEPESYRAAADAQDGYVHTAYDRASGRGPAIDRIGTRHDAGGSPPSAHGWCDHAAGTLPDLYVRHLGAGPEFGSRCRGCPRESAGDCGVAPGARGSRDGRRFPDPSDGDCPARRRVRWRQRNGGGPPPLSQQRPRPCDWRRQQPLAAGVRA